MQPGPEEQGSREGLAGTGRPPLSSWLPEQASSPGHTENRQEELPLPLLRNAACLPCRGSEKHSSGQWASRASAQPFGRGRSATQQPGRAGPRLGSSSRVGYEGPARKGGSTFPWSGEEPLAWHCRGLRRQRPTVPPPPPPCPERSCPHLGPLCTTRFGQDLEHEQSTLHSKRRPISAGKSPAIGTSRPSWNTRVRRASLLALRQRAPPQPPVLPWCTRDSCHVRCKGSGLGSSPRSTGRTASKGSRG